MDTRAANGLGFGVFLALVGAILRYAVDVTVTGVDLQVVGAIFLGAGVLLTVVALASALTAGHARRSETYVERRVEDDRAVEDGRSHRRP